MLIEYDDGDRKWHSMWEEEFRWLGDGPAVPDGVYDGNVPVRGTRQPTAAANESKQKVGTVQTADTARSLGSKAAAGSRPPAGSSAAHSVVLSGSEEEEEVLLAESESDVEEVMQGMTAHSQRGSASASVEPAARRRLVHDNAHSSAARPGVKTSAAAKTTAKRSVLDSNKNGSGGGTPLWNGGLRPMVKSTPRKQVHILARDLIQANSRTLGSKVSAPYFLRPQPALCTCGTPAHLRGSPAGPCPDKCCTRYDYYDAIKHWAKPEHSDSTFAMIKFELNTGMRVISDNEGGEKSELIALFAGARVHREDGRFEALHNWFIHASDHQAHEWKRTPLGQSNLSRWPTPPPNLVYRLGGVHLADSENDWSTVSAIIGACRIVQVPTMRILTLCERARRTETAFSIFYYDSTCQMDSDGVGAPPVQLAGSSRRHLIERESSSDDDDDDQSLARPRARHTTAPRPTQSQPHPRDSDASRGRRRGGAENGEDGHDARARPRSQDAEQQPKRYE